LIGWLKNALPKAELLPNLVPIQSSQAHQSLLSNFEFSIYNFFNKHPASFGPVAHLVPMAEPSRMLDYALRNRHRALHSSRFINFEMFYAYILKSTINNSYYIGSCEDLNVRIHSHNKGLVKSTKRYLPWRLVYFEKYPDLKAARRRELQIKSWKKRKAVEKLINSINSKASFGNKMTLAALAFDPAAELRGIFGSSARKSKNKVFGFHSLYVANKHFKI